MAPSLHPETSFVECSRLQEECTVRFGILGVVGLGLVQACMLEPDVQPMSIQVFRCAQLEGNKCLAVGEEIPRGQLPPANETFLMLARYRGRESTWTLMFPSVNLAGQQDSLVMQVSTRDSASIWMNLMGARDGFYVQRVTTSSYNVVDSLVWDYGWRRGTFQQQPAHSVSGVLAGTQ
jgi:hypothetical protein